MTIKKYRVANQYMTRVRAGRVRITYTPFSQGWEMSNTIAVYRFSLGRIQIAIVK